MTSQKIIKHRKNKDLQVKQLMKSSLAVNHVSMELSLQCFGDHL
jgi:hypothetical protein